MAKAFGSLGALGRQERSLLVAASGSDAFDGSVDARNQLVGRIKNPKCEGDDDGMARRKLVAWLRALGTDRMLGLLEDLMRLGAFRTADLPDPDGKEPPGANPE